MQQAEFFQQTARARKPSKVYCGAKQVGKLREVAVVVQFDKEAGQTRDYCVAKNATRGAAAQIPRGAKNACSG
jgi:hypothetical protein